MDGLFIIHLRLQTLESSGTEVAERRVASNAVVEEPVVGVTMALESLSELSLERAEEPF